jgi:hypothetical protein
LHAKEGENLEKKQSLIQQLKEIDLTALKTNKQWEDATEKVQAIQQEWRTIGFAPKKYNQAVYEEYRQLCEAFFKAKTAYYKSMRDELAENLRKKRALVAQAQQLKDSTDWKTTAEELNQLQKEWKKIGPISKKHSEAIWKRFVSACDYFFEQKNKAEAVHKNEEQLNLEKKKAIITQLTEINKSDSSIDKSSLIIRQLMKEWNGIGHVPFKEKDKIYKQYRQIVDELYGKLNQSASKKKLNNFKSRLNKEANLYKEREKLVRVFENLKNEIKTYENNLGFLSSSSKKGNSLVTEINRKVEKLKDELTLITKKIEVIDESIQNQ